MAVFMLPEDYCSTCWPFTSHLIAERPLFVQRQLSGKHHMGRFPPGWAFPSPSLLPQVSPQGLLLHHAFPRVCCLRVSHLFSLFFSFSGTLSCRLRPRFRRYFRIFPTFPGLRIFGDFQSARVTSHKSSTLSSHQMP